MLGLGKGVKARSRYDIGKPTANEPRARAVVVPVPDRHRAGDLESQESPGAVHRAGVAGDAVGSPQPLTELRLEVHTGCSYPAWSAQTGRRSAQTKILGPRA
jgi:hypothetical protein